MNQALRTFTVSFIRTFLQVLMGHSAAIRELYIEVIFASKKQVKLSHINLGVFSNVLFISPSD